jgi:1,4-dihydroxy-2-naphthoate octaprenyltransferase
MGVSMNPVRAWIQLARAPYFPVVAVPIVVGAAYALWDAFEFRWTPFLLTLAGGAAVYLGGMVTVSILEIVLGDETADPDSEPSRLEGPEIIAASFVRLSQAGGAAALMLILALACGVALVPHSGSFAIGIGFAGLLLAIFYAVPDLGLRDLGHGVSEIAAFVAVGLLPVLGGYASQSGSFTVGAALASLPLGFFGAAIVYDHHLARFLRGETAAGTSLAMDLGEERARLGCSILPMLAYAAILLDVALGEYPPSAAWALGTAPFLVWKLLRFDGRDPEACEDLTRSTAAVHVLTGMLIALGFLVSGIR